MGLLDALTSGLGHTTQSTNTAVDQATMEKLKEKYLELQAQRAQQAHMAQQAYPYGYSLGQNAYQQIQQPVEPTINLKEGAWDVPISQLVDLWTVRYGSAWVDESELDEFYSVAATRLSSLNRLERHNVNMKIVNRIVE